jgi:hypothetical protein
MSATADARWCALTWCDDEAAPLRNRDVTYPAASAPVPRGYAGLVEGGSSFVAQLKLARGRRDLCLPGL